jgi:hypothetical protein
VLHYMIERGSRPCSTSSSSNCGRASFRRSLCLRQAARFGDSRRFGAGRIAERPVDTASYSSFMPP